MHPVRGSPKFVIILNKDLKPGERRDSRVASWQRMPAQVLNEFGLWDNGDEFRRKIGRREVGRWGDDPRLRELPKRIN